MSAPVLTTVPSRVRAGDTVAWRIAHPLFPAGDGWALEYALINAERKLTIASVADGDAHLVNVSAATSAAWVAGRYEWACRATDGTSVHTIGTGSMDILPDLSAHVALDTRSHAEKTLAALEAWIERHDLAVAEYQIAGRVMKYIPIAELMKLHDQYRREVRATSGKSGRIYLRF